MSPRLMKRDALMSAWIATRDVRLVLPAVLAAALSLASAARLPAQVVSDHPGAETDLSSPFISTSSPQCSYSLSTTTVSAPAEGGHFGVNVVTRPGCDWTVTTAVRWVTLSVVRGVGRGAALFEIHPNSSTASRSGTMDIAGQTVTIQQDGAPPCSFSVSPTYIRMPPAGGSGVVSVDVRSGCTWPVTSNQNWLAPSVTSGTGSAKLSFTAEENDERMGRTAELTVGPCVVWVSQSGKPRRTR